MTVKWRSFDTFVSHLSRVSFYHHHHHHHHHHSFIEMLPIERNLSLNLRYEKTVIFDRSIISS